MRIFHAADFFKINFFEKIFQEYHLKVNSNTPRL